MSNHAAAKYCKNQGFLDSFVCLSTTPRCVESPTPNKWIWKIEKRTSIGLILQADHLAMQRPHYLPSSCAFCAAAWWGHNPEVSHLIRQQCIYRNEYTGIITFICICIISQSQLNEENGTIYSNIKYSQPNALIFILQF